MLFSSCARRNARGYWKSLTTGRTIGQENGPRKEKHAARGRNAEKACTFGQSQAWAAARAAPSALWRGERPEAVSEKAVSPDRRPWRSATLRFQPREDFRVDGGERRLS